MIMSWRVCVYLLLESNVWASHWTCDDMCCSLLGSPGEYSLIFHLEDFQHVATMWWKAQMVSPKKKRTCLEACRQLRALLPHLGDIQPTRLLVLVWSLAWEPYYARGMAKKCLPGISSVIPSLKCLHRCAVRFGPGSVWCSSASATNTTFIFPSKWISLSISPLSNYFTLYLEKRSSFEFCDPLNRWNRH